KADAVFAFQLR
nr:RecName: Full=Sulfate adenylyltransferase; AltName: Full=ATP-sulfurylase; AltName: Full=Sulfate adenylate transferase; Short=SAT [Populus euphratica]